MAERRARPRPESQNAPAARRRRREGAHRSAHHRHRDHNIVWAFGDGRAGHENQIRGLVQALADRLPVACHWINVPPAARLLPDLLHRRFAPGAALPDPDLLIGAGHATHLALIAARRARGGRSVVLMTPSLPRAWFDLCVVPEHDGVDGPNVFITRGALNALRPAARREAASGLILIGGPSRHHGWSEDGIVEQVRALATRAPLVRWTITTSRRTPMPTVARLRALEFPNLRLVPFEDTAPDWLPARLARCRRAWVSEDSVSMVFEALTAGAATGLLEVPRRGDSRVARGVEALAREGLVTPFAHWRAGERLRAPEEPFNEAARVAAWIEQTWKLAG